MKGSLRPRPVRWHITTPGDGFLPVHQHLLVVLASRDLEMSVWGLTLEIDVGVLGDEELHNSLTLGDTG